MTIGPLVLSQLLKGPLKNMVGGLEVSDLGELQSMQADLMKIQTTKNIAEKRRLERSLAARYQKLSKKMGDAPQMKGELAQLQKMLPKGALPAGALSAAQAGRPSKPARSNSESIEPADTRPQQHLLQPRKKKRKSPVVSWTNSLESVRTF